MVEFRILRGGSKAKIKITALDFRRKNLASSRMCLEESYATRRWKKEGSKKAG